MVLGEIAFVFHCLRLLLCLFRCRSTDFVVVYPVSWAGWSSSAQLTVPPTVFSWCLSNFFEWSCLFPVISPSFDNPISSSIVVMISARPASSLLSRLGSSHPVSDDHDDVALSQSATSRRRSRPTSCPVVPADDARRNRQKRQRVFAHRQLV